MPCTILLAATATTAIEAGLSYGHALQARGKRELPAEALMHFHTRVLAPYRAGAGVVEVAAFAATAAATARLGGDRRARISCAGALLGQLAAFTTWVAGIQPVNNRLSTWKPGSAQQEVPANWTLLRDRWHRLHSVRLALLSASLGALITSGWSSDRHR